MVKVVLFPSTGAGEPEVVFVVVPFPPETDAATE
jgi:hypothetical protein